MVFNLDTDGQAVETLCSKKRKKDNYLPLTFHGNNLQTAISKKVGRRT